MSVDPKISVVTVVLNDQLNIENTIKSVLSQDYQNIEYLIIDGKSNDSTIEIIKKYDSRVYEWISEEDSGIYDAMNKGIDLASGEFIIFMNSGDTFFNEKTVSKVFLNKAAINKDVIFGDTCVDFQSYKKIIRGEYPKKNNPMTFNHQSVFLKNSLMKSFKFNLSYKICADKDLFAYLYKMNLQYFYSSEIIAKIAAFGFSNSNRVKTLREVKAIYKKHNISNITSVNISILKAHILNLIELIFGKNITNSLRQYLKR